MHGDANEIDPHPPPAGDTIQKDQKHRRADQRDESEQKQWYILRNHRLLLMRFGKGERKFIITGLLQL